MFYLKSIQNAKTMYAYEYTLTNDVVFTKEQLLPYLGLSTGQWPRCPAGGQYSIGTLHESPTCSYSNHINLRVPVK